FVQFVDPLVLAPEEVVLHSVAAQRVRRAVLRGDEQRIKERRVVVAMIDGAKVSLNVAIAQMLQTVHMVGVPVSEMFNVPVLVFDLAEALLLVLTVLKETDGVSTCPRAGLDDAGDMDFKFVPVLLVRADDAAAGFILIKPVTFFKNGDECSLRYDEAHFVRR